MERFSIRREQLQEDAHAVVLSGRFDLHAAPALKRELLDAVDRGGRTIVVDLSDATLLDPTPLGVLLGLNKRLGTTGAKLSVVCDGALLAFVRRSGLDQILDVVAARPARAAVSRRPAYAAA